MYKLSKIDVAESIAIIGLAIESSEHSYSSQRKKHQRIELRTYNNICFLKRGGVSFYRLENDVLTITLTAPAILGLAQMRNEKNHIT